MLFLAFLQLALYGSEPSTIPNDWVGYNTGLVDSELLNEMDVSPWADPEHHAASLIAQELKIYSPEQLVAIQETIGNLIITQSY